MSFSLLLLTTIFIGFLSYYLWIWSYWIRKNVKGPRGLPFTGLLHFFQNHAYPAVFHFRDWTKKYGPVYGITEGVQKTLVVSDPEFVHEVFVKQFDNFYGRHLNPIQGDPDKDKRSNVFLSHGHRWKRLRTLSSPSFSNQNLKKVMGTVQESVGELMRFLEMASIEGKAVDILDYYHEYTLDVIGKIAMGQTDSIMFKNPLLAKLKATFPSDRGFLYLICGIFPFLGPIFRGIFIMFPSQHPIFEIMASLEKVVKKRIDQRKENEERGIPSEPLDFIDLFLDAQTEQEVLDKEKSFSKSQISKIDRRLTVDEITGQLLLFLLAGFDTTALSLAYSTYLLAMNPEVQKTLQEEVDKECPNPEVTFDQLSKLKFMDCVVKETLRLYPMASIFHSRKCMKTTKVCGMEIEEGVNIQADTWSLHYDPKIWGDDVNEFKPERWLSPDDQVFQKGGYVPFGNGPRACIAMRLAQMEIKMLLAYILRKYSFETTEATDIPLKLSGRTTIGPKSVMVVLTGRHID